MASFDLTLLQSSLAPVAAGVTVALYAAAPSAMSPAQIVTFVSGATAAASGTTDINGHLTVTLPVSTSYLVTAVGFNATYLTTPAGAGPVFQVVYPSTVLCRVTGNVSAPDGTPQSNVTVVANLNASGPIDGTHLILSSAPTTTTDTNGNWVLNLTPNDLIVPKNTLYNFVFTQPAAVVPAYPFFSFGAPVRPQGPSIARSVEVPNVTTIDFSALVG